MRILFLSRTLPHADAVSGRIIVYQRIRLLAERGHHVGLAAFVAENRRHHIPEAREIVRELEVLPTPEEQPRAQRWREWARGRLPAPFADVHERAMQRLVGSMVERSHYDVVVAEFSEMGQYLYRNPFLPAVRRVISCHTCLTTALRKEIRIQGGSPLQAAANAWRLAGLARYEFGMYGSADHVLVLTPQERQTLLDYAPRLHISVVPYGVDAELFRPGPPVEGQPYILFTGYYPHHPNRDAVLWFARTVWPQLRTRYPTLQFYVVGRSPTPDMRELVQRDPSIVITGEVPDIAPYLRRARVYICPVRMGTGFRGKVLQAMSAGVPVVSTQLGAEGIPAQTGHNIMLADTPHMMAEAVRLVLDDPGLRARITANARELVMSRFSWAHCVDLLESVLRQVVKTRGGFPGPRG